MRRTTTRRPLAGSWRAWLGVALALVLTSPASASAHAELRGTQPTNETTLQTHPERVTLTFTENVDVPFGGVKAYAPDGSRADTGRVRVEGSVVTAAIDTEADGTYAVSWRAVSADGHPIRGAFVFHVTAKSDGRSRDEALRASEGSRLAEVAFAIVRGGYLAGILVAAGAGLFMALVAPTWRPRLLWPGVLLAAACIGAAYLLDASIAAGTSPGETLRAELLREQADTVYGRASLLRIGALATYAAAWLLVEQAGRAGTRTGRIAIGVLAAALAATLSISGHAMGEDATVLRLPLDMLHSIAAAAWLGGLVQLFVLLRAPSLDASAVLRWSRLAMAAFVVLVLTGLYASWQEIGLSVDALLQTRYGLLVLAKACLLLAAVPLANTNRSRHVRRIHDAETQADAAAGMRRLVRGELAILALVVAVTAWLVQVPPAKVELRPDRFAETAKLASGATIQLIVDPAALGTNEVHVYAFDEQLQPDADVTDVVLTARQPGNDELGTLELEVEAAGPGHYTTDAATIPFAGTWKLTASVRRGEFEEERARFSVPVSTSPDQE